MFIMKIIVSIILLAGMIANYKYLPPVSSSFMIIVTIFYIILMFGDE